MVVELKELSDIDLIKRTHDLARSVSYFNAAEGNWASETVARKECQGKFNAALKEMETRGLEFENKGYLL